MLTLWLSAVDADALTDAALSLSEVDFDALSLAEADLLTDSLVALLVLVL